MLFKRLTSAKGGGRQNLKELDNVLAIIFMIIIVTSALVYGNKVFAYFCMGLIVARIGEIIFEVKHNLFDKPFFHCLLMIGIPAQILWNIFAN